MYAIFMYLYVYLLQCLEVIKEALSDPHVRESKRLSLLQRARRICTSKQTTADNKQSKKATVGKKRRVSSTSSVDAILPYGIADFPNMDIIEAPEVSTNFVAHFIKKLGVTRG